MSLRYHNIIRFNTLTNIIFNMAAKNRTDLTALINNWAATLNLETRHKPDELEILESVLLNRDVTNTIAVIGAATAVNFSGYDTININTTLDTVLTISNLAVGEFKFLIISKDQGNQINFANATDMSYSLAYNHTLSSLIYLMVNKGDSGIIAYPLHKTFDFSALPALPTKGEWQEASLTSPWIAGGGSGVRTGLWYRLYDEYIDISCCVYRSAAFADIITTLPVGYRPAYGHVVTASFYGASMEGDISIKTDGQISINMYSGSPLNIHFSAHIPLT